ncbi:hypothetical protein PPACK8108_LOCUS13203 [Phakopsora pachyrhizi]|uniref:Uncharacterized protein n=1 Tax=Phakopsora pachyrhizi TaxID=170000 RepID=A0AAV0B4I8_PHAPC|nr:hypothetical protein PPACK8108_LOCUS13203 [Phakopsora pachyrhizi]
MVLNCFKGWLGQRCKFFFFFLADVLPPFCQILLFSLPFFYFISYCFYVCSVAYPIYLYLYFNYILFFYYFYYY